MTNAQPPECPRPVPSVPGSEQPASSIDCDYLAGSDVIPAIRTPRHTTSRDFYQAYLNSPTWRVRRNRALQLALWRCSRCESKRDLEVHHLSYERLGAELDADLEVLCAGCHEGHHLEEGAQQHLGVYVKVISEILRVKNYTAIGDVAEAAKIRCAQLKIPYLAQHIDAALMLVRDRIPLAQLPRAVGRVSMPDWTDDDIPKAEAEGILKMLNVKVGLRSMPKARLVRQSQIDRAKALKMVAAEIMESVARCEELEATVKKPHQDPQ